MRAELSGRATGPANDMVLDGAGRAYVGNFGFDLMTGAPLETASLCRVDPDGTVTEAADDMWFPNGSVITIWVAAGGRLLRVGPRGLRPGDSCGRPSGVQTRRPDQRRRQEVLGPGARPSSRPSWETSMTLPVAIDSLAARPMATLARPSA